MQCNLSHCRHIQENPQGKEILHLQSRVCYLMTGDRRQPHDIRNIWFILKKLLPLMFILIVQFVLILYISPLFFLHLTIQMLTDKGALKWSLKLFIWNATAKCQKNLRLCNRRQTKKKNFFPALLRFSISESIRDFDTAPSLPTLTVPNK